MSGAKQVVPSPRCPYCFKLDCFAITDYVLAPTVVALASPSARLLEVLGSEPVVSAEGGEPLLGADDVRATNERLWDGPGRWLWNTGPNGRPLQLQGPGNCNVRVGSIFDVMC